MANPTSTSGNDQKREGDEHGRRQVTVQPQEKATEAGKPHVPHTRVKEPGKPLPENDEESSTDADVLSSRKTQK